MDGSVEKNNTNNEIMCFTFVINGNIQKFSRGCIEPYLGLHAAHGLQFVYPCRCRKTLHHSIFVSDHKHQNKKRKKMYNQHKIYFHYGLCSLNSYISSFCIVVILIKNCVCAQHYRL